jgi:hypothetical protein
MQVAESAIYPREIFGNRSFRLIVVIPVAFSVLAVTTWPNTVRSVIRTLPRRFMQSTLEKKLILNVCQLKLG